MKIAMNMLREYVDIPVAPKEYEAVSYTHLTLPTIA